MNTTPIPFLNQPVARGSVLVAEDQAPLRTSLVAALRLAGFGAEGAASGAEASEQLVEAAFDVLLADINMPGNYQLELVAAVRARQVAVVLMTGYPSIETAVGALQAGAVDYLMKPFSQEVLVDRLDRAVGRARAARSHRREHWQAFTSEDLLRLSSREREVACLLACGRAPKEIAAQLGLSPNTVRNHVKSVFTKLGVHSRVELVLRLEGLPIL